MPATCQCTSHQKKNTVDDTVYFVPHNFPEHLSYTFLPICHGNVKMEAVTLVHFETTNCRLWSPYLVKYLFPWKCFLSRSDKKCWGAAHLSPEKSNIQSIFLVIRWKLSVVLLLHSMTLLDLCCSCSLEDILRNMYSCASQYRKSRDQQISSVIGGFSLLPI